ncbi:hypothetical protein ACFCYH_35205 [Streptomyces sp. NPDC056400]|uniref:hypothetical protein n=1 Tax=Streptomyces sp. NPDC056400 TaxID=3345808 RepID=UPI0035D7BDAD
MRIRTSPAGESPLTAPEAVIIVIVLVIAAALALSGLPGLSVLVLVGDALTIGVRFARRIHERAVAPRPVVA